MASLKDYRQSSSRLQHQNNDLQQNNQRTLLGSQHATSMKDFNIGKKIGDGAYSMVYLVTRKSDGIEYALKQVKLGALNDKEKTNALNEVRILASIENANIVAYKEAFFDEPSSCLCIVMEFAPDGDLYQKIVHHKKAQTMFTEREIWDCLVQMTKGLKALHDLKILHRDLKSANVFMGEDGVFKLGDLNVSKVAQQNGLLMTQTGTPYYASPEVWKDQPYDNKSDIWSLGCVIYEMTTLNPPFRAQSMDKLFQAVLSGSYPKIASHYSRNLSHLIKLLLQVDPGKRPSCEQILNLQIIQKFIANASQHGCFPEPPIPLTNREDLQNEDLLKTIQLPKNLSQLQQVLPKSRYNHQTTIESHPVLPTLQTNRQNIISLAEQIILPPIRDLSQQPSMQHSPTAERPSNKNTQYRGGAAQNHNSNNYETGSQRQNHHDQQPPHQQQQIVVNNPSRQMKKASFVSHQETLNQVHELDHKPNDYKNSNNPNPSQRHQSNQRNAPEHQQSQPQPNQAEPRPVKSTKTRASNSLQGSLQGQRRGLQQQQLQSAKDAKSNYLPPAATQSQHQQNSQKANELQTVSTIQQRLTADDEVLIGGVQQDYNMMRQQSERLPQYKKNISVQKTDLTSASNRNNYQLQKSQAAGRPPLQQQDHENKAVGAASVVSNNDLQRPGIIHSSNQNSNSVNENQVPLQSAALPGLKQSLLNIRSAKEIKNINLQNANYQSSLQNQQHISQPSIPLQGNIPNHHNMSQEGERNYNFVARTNSSLGNPSRYNSGASYQNLTNSQKKRAGNQAGSQIGMHLPPKSSHRIASTQIQTTSSKADAEDQQTLNGGNTGFSRDGNNIDQVILTAESQIQRSKQQLLQRQQQGYNHYSGSQASNYTNDHYNTAPANNNSQPPIQNRQDFLRDKSQILVNLEQAAVPSAQNLLQQNNYLSQSQNASNQQAPSPSAQRNIKMITKPIMTIQQRLNAERQHQQQQQHQQIMQGQSQSNKKPYPNSSRIGMLNHAGGNTPQKATIESAAPNAKAPPNSSHLKSIQQHQNNNNMLQGGGGQPLLIPMQGLSHSGSHKLLSSGTKALPTIARNNQNQITKQKNHYQSNLLEKSKAKEVGQTSGQGQSDRSSSLFENQPPQHLLMPTNNNNNNGVQMSITDRDKDSNNYDQQIEPSENVEKLKQIAVMRKGTKASSGVSVQSRSMPRRATPNSGRSRKRDQPSNH